MDVVNRFEQLIRFFQKQNPGLDVDGILGPKTIAKLDELYRPTEAPSDVDLIKLACREANPSILYGERFRKPVVTSGHYNRNPSRPGHNGCDLFFRYDVFMGPAVVKDGEAAGSPGKPKWFVPKGTLALSILPGRVHSVTLLKTGICVWVEHSSITPGSSPLAFFTGYMHLDSALVKRGDGVVARSPLGTVGDNPVDNDARHLHFELFYRPDRTPPTTGYSREYTLDPQKFFDFTTP